MNPVHEPVRGSRLVHGSRFTDSGRVLVGSRFTVRPDAAPPGSFTVRGSPLCPASVRVHGSEFMVGSRVKTTELVHKLPFTPLTHRHSSRTTVRESPVNRDPEIRRKRRDDGLPVPLPAGRLSPLSSNIQLPPTPPTPTTYGFYFRTHIALVHRRTTSTTSILKTTSSTSFTWTWDGFTRP